jgi:hypothetical protein
MATSTIYWLSFRLHTGDAEGKTYEERYKAFVEAVVKCGSRPFWEDTTSFVVFRSERAVGDIALRLRQAIAVSADIFLIHARDQQSGCISGAIKDSNIFMLMPYLKKV